MDTDFLNTIEDEAIETLKEWKDRHEEHFELTLKAANALRSIRDNEIHTLRKCETVEAWAEKFCGISRSWYYKVRAFPDMAGLIEDKIETEPSLKKLDRKVIKKIKTLPVSTLANNAAAIKKDPVRAIRAIAKVVEKTKEPTREAITEAIERAVPTDSMPLVRMKPKSGDHPLIVAMDEEWRKMSTGGAYTRGPAINPAEVFKKMRELAVKFLNS